ncbi:MAG: hypothetical protein WC700_10370 [Gemmatimonadaceae bacterium]
MVGEMAGYLMPGAGGVMTSVGGAAERALLGAAPGALRTAGAVAGRGAVEGAMAGLGEGASELALDDAELTGERMAGVLGSSMLRGAGYGAGAAAGLHLGGKLIGGGVKRALERSAPRGEAGEPGVLLRGLAEAQSRMTGASKDDILRLWRGKSAKRAVMDAPRVADDATKSIADDLTAVLAGGEKLRPLHVGGTREATFSHLVEGGLDAQVLQARAIAGQYRAVLDELAGDAASAHITKGFRRDFGAELDTLGARLDDAVASGSGAAVNQELNAIKQAIGRAKTSTDGAASKVGGKRWAWQDPARRFDELYEQARTSLEDVATWGKAGAAQAAINKPVSDHLAFTRFRDRFTTQHGKDRFRELYVGDSKKVGSLVKSLGGADAALDKEVLLKVVRGRADAAKALLDHAGPQMGKVEHAAAHDTIAAADRIAKTLDDAEGTLSLAKAFDGVRARDGASSAAVVGGIIGGAPGAALGGLIGAASAPGKTIAQLAALQNLTGRMGDRVSAGLRGTFALAKPGGAAFSLPRLVQPLDGSSRDEAYRTRAESARLAATTPAQVRSEVERQLLEQLPRAPSTARAAADAAARQHEALRRAAPPATSKFLLGPAPTPSPTEIDRMRRAQRAVADYPSIIDDVRAGTVSPETVEILRSVYPAEYADIKRRAMDDIAEARAKGKTLPYEQRRSLGLLLGEPVEPLQDPGMSSDIRAAFAPAAPPAPHATPGQRRERVNSYRTGSQETAADEG